MSLMQRSNINHKEKQNIASRISEMIHDNDTIILNAGTTPLFVMRAISDKKITLLTNSIALALEGASNPNFKIILLGGDVDSSYQFTHGALTMRELEHYTADMLILSADGIDPKSGLTTFYHQEAELCKSMIRHSKKTIVAADFSKIGRVAFTKVDSLHSVDTIVTNDRSFLKPVFKKLRATGIEVVTVP